jgi:hypothetical protein
MQLERRVTGMAPLLSAMVTVEGWLQNSLQANFFCSAMSHTETMPWIQVGYVIDIF